MRQIFGVFFGKDEILVKLRLSQLIPKLSQFSHFLS